MGMLGGGRTRFLIVFFHRLITRNLLFKALKILKIRYIMVNYDDSQYANMFNNELQSFEYHLFNCFLCMCRLNDQLARADLSSAVAVVKFEKSRPPFSGDVGTLLWFRRD